MNEPSSLAPPGRAAPSCPCAEASFEVSALAELKRELKIELSPSEESPISAPGTAKAYTTALKITSATEHVANGNSTHAERKRLSDFGFFVRIGILLPRIPYCCTTR